MSLALTLGGSLSACTPAPAPAPPTPSPAWSGSGFVDLTTALDHAPPFALHLLPGTAVPENSTGALGDLDGDGQPEVLLAPRCTPCTADQRVAIYHYDPVRARLVPYTGPAPDPHWVPFLVADLDGDGVTDVLGTAGGLRVAWGLAPGGYAPPVPLVAMDLGAASFEATNAFLDDLDDDGWLDILTGARTCLGGTCSDVYPLLRTAPRVFEARTDLVASAPQCNPYAVFSAVLGPRERVLGVLGHSASSVHLAPGFYRAAGRNTAGFPLYVPFDPFPLTADFRDPLDPTPTPISFKVPMAAAADDLDGDGVPDLAVALDPGIVLYAGTATWPLRTPPVPTPFRRYAGSRGLDMIPWGTAFVDIDRDGRPDLVAAYGNDEGAWTDPARQIGPQHAAVFRNTGSFGFIDATSEAHLARGGQWRALVVGDLDADGAADLLVGGAGELPRVYRNAADNGLHGFALRLRGTSSNALGVGARVEVLIAPGMAEQHHVAGGIGSPDATSEPLVFVGLGTAASAQRVRITWPTGTVQDLLDVPSGGVHTVTEPPLFVIQPATRHALADGLSVVTVTVTPRRPDGTPRPDAHLDAHLDAGSGTLDTPPTQDPTTGAFTVRVRAPTAPGSTVLTLHIDGVASGVRPRLWWDAPAP